jgi:hypothetical protein
MREIIQAILAFGLGAAVGLFVYAQIVFPIVYAVPRALVSVCTGRLKAGALLYFTAVPVAWVGALIAVGYMLQWAAPTVADFFLTNWFFNFGNICGLALLVQSFFSSEGRAAVRADFHSATLPYQR